MTARLKALGVKQESYFYFVDNDDEDLSDNNLQPSQGYSWSAWPAYENYNYRASAFTVSELLELMPNAAIGNTPDEKYPYWCSIKKEDYPHPKIEDGHRFFNVKSDNPAEAAAQMLIELLSHNLLKLPA